MKKEYFSYIVPNSVHTRPGYIRAHVRTERGQRLERWNSGCNSCAYG